MRRPIALAIGILLVIRFAYPSRLEAQTVRAKPVCCCTANVKTFGAKGDGVADDTAAIQAAIDGTSTGILFFPKGTYRVTSTLAVSAKNSLTLVGEGSFYGTMIQSEHDGNVFELRTCSQAGISNLHLVRAGTAAGGFGIALVRGAALHDRRRAHGRPVWRHPGPGLDELHAAARAASKPGWPGGSAVRRDVRRCGLILSVHHRRPRL